jgi:hypothetical protein
MSMIRGVFALDDHAWSGRRVVDASAERKRCGRGEALPGRAGITAELKVGATSVTADLKVGATSVRADLKLGATSVRADLRRGGAAGAHDLAKSAPELGHRHLDSAGASSRSRIASATCLAS